MTTNKNNQTSSNNQHFPLTPYIQEIDENKTEISDVFLYFILNNSDLSFPIDFSQYIK